MIHTQVLINLQPPQEAHHISHNSNYIYHREGKRMIRKIFYNVDYDDFESEKILELERVIKSQQLDLPSSWDRANTLKYCYYGQFNIKKSINGVKQHLDWLREKKWHKLTPQALEYLKQGLIYQYGFDKQLRPLIFLDFSKFDYNEVDFFFSSFKINIDDFMIAAIFVFDKAKKYSFIPGKIENWIIFLDLKGVQIQDLPYNVVKTFFKSLLDNQKIHKHALCQFYLLYGKNICFISSFIFQNSLECSQAYINQLNNTYIQLFCILILHQKLLFFLLKKFSQFSKISLKINCRKNMEDPYKIQLNFGLHNLVCEKNLRRVYYMKTKIFSPEDLVLTLVFKMFRSVIIKSILYQNIAKLIMIVKAILQLKIRTSIRKIQLKASILRNYLIDQMCTYQTKQFMNQMNKIFLFAAEEEIINQNNNLNAI